MGPHTAPAPRDHKARPKCLHHEPNGTFARDKDGEPADLLNMRDYPIRSMCCLCGAVIVTYGMFGRAADWYDVE
jgi:hypothetical protein